MVFISDRLCLWGLGRILCLWRNFLPCEEIFMLRKFMWIFFSAYSWYFAFVLEFALVFFGIVNGLCVFVLDMFSRGTMLLVLFVIIAYLVLLYLLLPLPLLILQLSMGRCVCSPRRQTSTLTTPYMLTCNSLGKPLPANSDILFLNRGLAPRLLWKLSVIFFL